jgi:hypothetical protein
MQVGSSTGLALETVPPDKGYTWYNATAWQYNRYPRRLFPAFEILLF